MELNNSNPYVDKDIRLLLLTILDSDFAFAFTLTGLASTRQEHNEPAETVRAYAESTAAGIERLLDLADVLTINGGAIIDHKAPRERRFVAVEK